MAIGGVLFYGSTDIIKAMIYAAVFAFGLIIGSFLNVGKAAGIL